MAKCRNILTMSIDEPLELMHTPFISIVGAGQHYADRLPPNSFIFKPSQLGHARLVNAQSGFDAGIDLTVDLKEYDGEWFDPHDVSNFLESLDLRIDPRSTFTETAMVTGSALHTLLVSSGLISPEGPKALSSGNSSIDSSPRLAHITAGTLHDGTTRLFPELGVNGSESVGAAHAAADWLMGASARTPDFVSPTEDWNGVQQWPTQPLTPPGSRTSRPSSRNITLDVGSMIDYIINRGICLGRSPGFRRRDVERAITTSVIEVE